MARRGVEMNGGHYNAHMPPASTLAAQIVQNQTRQAEISQNGGEAIFQQLLHEILHNKTAIQETDINVNAQLISVVAEAGLAPLTIDNPLVDWNKLQSQALDSIEVIKATINRQPSVIFTQIAVDGPPLVLRLLASLIGLYAGSKDKGLPIADLLDSIIGSINASLNFWPKGEAFREVVQGCVDDALAALEASPTVSSIIACRLPPARSMVKLWPLSEGSIAVPTGYTATLNDPAGAYILALDLSQLSNVAAAWQLDVQMRLQRIAIRLKPKLEKAQRWEYALDQLLSFPRNEILVSSLLCSFSQNRPSAKIQMLVGKELIQSLKRLSTAPSYPTKDALLPHIRVLGYDTGFENLQEDLKIALTAWLCRFENPLPNPDHIIQFRDALQQDTVMIDSEMLDAFRELCAASPGSQPQIQAPAKRKRVNLQTDSRKSQAIQKATILLTGVESDDISALENVSQSRYSRLSEADQCVTWQCLSDLAIEHIPIVADTALKLVQDVKAHRGKRSRVLSVQVIRMVVPKITEPDDLLRLGSSGFGQVCLQSLSSSIRELRIEAAQLLSCFLRNDLPEEIRTPNRQRALEYLRKLSDRNITNEQETLIYAWGQIGLVCSGKELNLILLSLIEYLGHSNSLVGALAFAEIERLAVHRAQTVEGLLSPFWSSIAVSVVQDLQKKPQKAQQLCDLLGKSVNQFLLATQRDTLPHLVFGKQREVLQRIANAAGNDQTIYQICMTPLTNLARILTLLIVQYAPGSENAAYECFLDVDENFRKTQLSDLVKFDTALVACELLKYLGDPAYGEKNLGQGAFEMLASLAADQQEEQRRSQSRENRSISTFFHNNILAVLTHFSTMLVSGPGGHSLSEKRQCLRALVEMFPLAKGELSVALPQIKACLQSGLDNSELRELAFNAWLSLLPVLKQKDLGQIIDETFALILRHWEFLSADLQHETYNKIAELVKAHKNLLKDNINTLPSLHGISEFHKFAVEFDRLRERETNETLCKSLAQRLCVDSETVALQALQELVPFLRNCQDFIHDTAASEHPDPILSDLVRALLDVTVKYSSVNADAAKLCGEALGILGCLDPNRIEATRPKRQILVLSNFDRPDEAIDWAAAFFEDVLVKAFKSVTNARAQGFLAYTMQELLVYCNFSAVLASTPPAPDSVEAYACQRWRSMPEHVRTTLTPFLTSKYVVTNVNATAQTRSYPSFSLDFTHIQWLRSLTYDLSLRAKLQITKGIFARMSRIIRTHDLAIARYLLPYLALNVVLGGATVEPKELSDEFLAVLSTHSALPTQQETIRLCSESVFASLDYMSTWLREKRKKLGESRATAFRTGLRPHDFDEDAEEDQIKTVENFLASIPAAVIANQAIECRSFARALFHWEQYLRQQGPLIPSSTQADDRDGLYGRLLDLYAQIDEPDGLEGISAHLPIVTEQQQATNHAKAGRWTAAQAWYELELSSDPTNPNLQSNILRCLRETGQYAPLLRYVDNFLSVPSSKGEAGLAERLHLPLAVEASWMTEDVAALERLLANPSAKENSNFNIGLGKCFLLMKTPADLAGREIGALRRSITESMSMSGTDSLQTCHDEMLKLHVLYELDCLWDCYERRSLDGVKTFGKRLTAVGSYVEDKQFILGVRRFAMQIFRNIDVDTNSLDGALWVTTAKLARKEGNTSLAHSAVLKAMEYDEGNAKLEEARLLWHEGHKRQAMRTLESAIDSGMFENRTNDKDTIMTGWTAESTVSVDKPNGQPQSVLSAKAHLLLAKWTDASGQSQTKDIANRYQAAARRFQRWEKGHYYLGKHYSKLLDVQKALPKEKRTLNFANGTLAELVINNFARSIPFGNKYWHETIPRALTLWFELATDTEKKAPKEDGEITERRAKALRDCTEQLKKYFERVPPYVFYHALPQLISRITHPHPDIWNQLCNILVRIVSAYPSQALWSLFAATKARDHVRVERGREVLNRVRDSKSKSKARLPPAELRHMILQGQKLSDGLIQACEAPVDQRATTVNLFTDLGFNAKLAPSELVVPIEATLAANSPSGATSDTIRKYQAFTQDKITIQAFTEPVLVLSSLQRPRKITVRGSDGKLYGLLCKPKDDLRKDQRLMEFNSLINRALKRDTESSKRRLYIKTYAVTPLSEESGTIEWVEGIKPIRDILLTIYSRKNVRPNYNDIRKDLDDACSDPKGSRLHIFRDKVLRQFAPSLHEWFAEVFPQPDTWFGARLRYARSAAVMSMTGHILGLGDRHGENILLEEGTGGVFHVDFNCLFDKGLTFEKPELVPFRLTHNMVDAMGAYGYEGPFRKSSELTLALLRQHRDTLMTVLETFLYDPTTDFVGKKKRSTAGVPETPAEILESVATKLKGLLRGETVPLSIEGYVDALIAEATDDFRLASMYIGWCSFL